MVRTVHRDCAKIVVEGMLIMVFDLFVIVAIFGVN